MKTLLILLLSCGARAAEPWTWSQDVRYRENHDPSMVWLADGRKLQVKFGVVALKIVAQWPRDKALQLVYDAKAGPRLVDPESKGSLPIIAGLDKHPIDSALDECIAKKSTTAGMVDCYREARGRWDGELDRAHGLLLASLDARGRQKAQDAQRDWTRFRDAQFDAIGTVNGGRQGTIWSVVAEREYAQVVREQAQRLAHLAGGAF